MCTSAGLEMPLILPADADGRAVVYEEAPAVAARGDGHGGAVPLTQLVCTLGPGSWRCPEQLFDAGMSVARLNCSHSRDGSDLRDIVPRLRAMAEQRGRPLLVLGDLQGPKTRVAGLVAGKMELVADAALVVDVQQHGADRGADFDGRIVLQPTHPCRALLAAAQPGATLSLDDGLMRLRVTAVGRTATGTATGVRAVVERGGTLTPGKGISLPGVRLATPALTPKDVTDAKILVRAGCDLVAMSFVREAADVEELRTLLSKYHQEAIDDGCWSEHGPPPLPKIVVKVETTDALKNAAAIIAATDGVMVARGDLAVDVGYCAVPLAQKRLLNACRVATPRQPFTIVATEMLASLARPGNLAPEPTRAEATDVVNAILDGADGVMTSGETTTGPNPVGAVKVMYALVCEAERALEPEELQRKAEQATVLRAIYDEGVAARKSPPAIQPAPELDTGAKPEPEPELDTALSITAEGGSAAEASSSILDEDEVDGDVSCLVCWEELPSSLTQKCSNCDHRFCAACLYGHCRVGIVDSGYAPACPMGNVPAEHGGCGTVLAAVDVFRVLRRHAIHAADSTTALPAVDAVINGTPPHLLYGGDSSSGQRSEDPKRQKDAEAGSWNALWNDDPVSRPELTDARVAALFGEMLTRQYYAIQQAVACPTQGCSTWVSRVSEDVASLQCNGCQQSFCALCRFSPMHAGTAAGEAGCAAVAEATPLWTEWLASTRSEWLERAAKAALDANTKDADNAYLKALQAWDQTAAGRATAIRDAKVRIEELRANEVWKSENCKHCPNCNRIINKLSGCDSMVCGRDWHGGNAQGGCGTHFDWADAPAYKPVDVRQPSRSEVTTQQGQAQGPPKSFGIIHYSAPGVVARCDICRRDVIGPRFSCLSCSRTDGRCFTACVVCDPSRAHDPAHVFSIDWRSSVGGAGSPRPGSAAAASALQGSSTPSEANDDSTAARQGLAVLPPAPRDAVIAFVRQASPGEALDLPPSLSEFQRRQVHAWAASVGIISRSKGTAAERHLVLYLARPPSLALLDSLARTGTASASASASKAAAAAKAAFSDVDAQNSRPRCYVLLAGRRGVGKDFIGGLLASVFDDSRGLRRKGKAVTRRLADTVKLAFCDANDLDFAKLSSTDADDRAYKESHRARLTAFFSAYAAEFASGADVLSHLGRGLVASVDDEGGTGAGAAANSDGVALVVVCDVRSPAEVAWFRSNCGHGRVFCVGVSCSSETLAARGTIADAAKDSDSTETGMDDYDKYDLKLANDDAGEAHIRQWAAAELLPFLFTAL